METVRVPDIGDFESVDVIEVLVSPGDRVEVEDSLITLESDKASMEIPSPVAGVVREVLVSVGDQVSEGTPIVRVEAEKAAAAEPEGAGDAREAESPEPAGEPPARRAPERPEAAAAADAGAPAPAGSGEPAADEPRGAAPREAPAPRQPARPAEEAGDEGEETTAEASAYWDETLDRAPAPFAHASPSVRRLARELGVDLQRVEGSGRRGRILREDLQAFVKSALSQGTGGGVPIAGVRVMRPPEIDFSKFGETELQPLGRIRRLSSANLHRSWVTVPHVTQFDEADVTALEEFRQSQRGAAEERGVKLTFLPFVAKAVARALLEFPHVNASLDPTGENLILKRYVHLGVAVDTPHGLVVPVLRDVDRKGILELAEELQDLSARARDRKLRPGDMQGGSFSISSLGGIGGSHFTPIVNHPEVAILGVGRMEWRPLFDGGAFVPRRILPLSLSYDHRVIDGADAARFTTRLAALLADLRLLVL